MPVRVKGAGAGVGAGAGGHADAGGGDRRRSQMIVSRRLVQTRFHRRRYWFGKPKLLVRLLK